VCRRALCLTRDFTYEQPLASLFGSHKSSIVELRGVEIVTSCLSSVSVPPLVIESVTHS
jgi:hypothetical protein